MYSNKTTNILVVLHLSLSPICFSGRIEANGLLATAKMISSSGSTINSENAQIIRMLLEEALRQDTCITNNHEYQKLLSICKTFPDNIQALNNKIKSLEQAANSHQAAATDAQNKLKHTEQARANAVAQYESLQKQATDLHKQKEAISLNLSNSQKLLEALNAEKSNLQKEKAQLSEQYNNTKATLEQQLIALENQKNAEANTLRQQIAQLAEEKNALIGKVQELEAISCENYKRLKNSERGAIEAIAERDAVIEKLESAQKERNRVMQEIEKKAEYILKHNLL